MTALGDATWKGCDREENCADGGEHSSGEEGNNESDEENELEGGNKTGSCQVSTLCAKSEAKRHLYCPQGADSWCKWQRDKAAGTLEYLTTAEKLPHVFFHELKGWV